MFLEKLIRSKIILFLLILAGISSIQKVQAGTLSCSVAATCPAGVVIWRMSGTSNAHAELPSQSNPNYTQLVCCTGVTGLGTSCGGTHAIPLLLSSVTNAHVEKNDQGHYANLACISVPTGGSVSVGYGTSCTGYDTTLGSIYANTNSHVGDGTAYTTKICASAHGVGSLITNIVDAGGATVPSPSVTLGSIYFSSNDQTASGILGISTQKIRVDNSTTNPQWSLTMAPSGGTTSLWSAGTPKYDFNDPTANAVDGGDADAYGGRMTINPAAGTITPKSGCNNTGVTLGSSAAYSEGVTNSVTLLSGGSSAAIDCYWDVTNAGVSQTIPQSQTVGNYSLNMMITLTSI